MKSFLLTSLLVFCFMMASFADDQIDSLLKIHQSGKADANTYNQLASKYFEVNTDSGAYFAKLALEYALHIDNPAQIAEAYYQMGDAYYYQDQLDSTIYYYQLSLEYYLKTKLNYEISGVYNDIGQVLQVQNYLDSSIIHFELALQYIDVLELPEGYYSILINIANSHFYKAEYPLANELYLKVLDEGSSYLSLDRLSVLYSNLGLSYRKSSNFDKAIIYYKKALTIDDSLHKKNELAIDYSNIGGAYFAWKQYDEALSFFKKAYEIYLQYGFSRDVSSSLSNMASVYRVIEKYEEAELNYKKALDIALACQDVFYEATALHGLGLIAYEKGEISNSIQFEKKALEKFQITQRANSFTNVYISLGRSYMVLKDFSKAKLYLTLADSLAQAHHTPELERDIALQWANYYMNTSENKKSIQQYRRFITLNDSVFNQKSHRLIAEFQIELDNLSKQRELEKVSLENEIKQAKIDNKNTVIWILSIGAFLLLLMGIYLAHLYGTKRKAYQLLFKKNKENLEAEKQVEDCRKNQLNNLISDELLKQITADLYKSMGDKVYLQTDLTIYKLAGLLNTNTSYLSKIINDLFQSNFNAFINKYRVLESQKLMHDPDYENYTIEAIAHECGFKSKSTFNEAFKKNTGLTPSYYLQQIKDNIS